MGLNLHAAVRGAITSVNPDRAIIWRQSTGATSNAAYKRTPTYAADQTVQAQIQALSGKDLQHPEMLNQQGVTRKVYLFGSVQGIVRPDAKGGDLLLFSQVLGGAVQTWLVVAVLETWTPDVPGWCSVGVVLQADA